MDKHPPDSHYLKAMKDILDSYPQHSPPVHPTQLTDQLYIGNQDNADDIILLQDLGITHVLNCIGTRNFDLTKSPYPPEAGIKGYLIIPAQDFEEFNIMKYFDDAIGFLDSATVSGGKVLVHCSIGVNRSGAIVAAYMMISQKKKLLDVIVELKTKRLLILCNMGFRKQLVQFARANDLLDEVEYQPQEKEVEDKDQKKEETPRVVERSPKLIDDDEIDDADEIKIKEKVINLKTLSKNVYPFKFNIDTLEEAKGVLVWSKLKDEEKLDLLSDKVTVKPSETKDYRYSNVLNLNNFKNVDPGIVLKVINESYDKFKKKSAKSPLEYKYSEKNFDYKYPLRQNITSKMKTMNEKNLSKEVDEFLSSSSSPIIKKYSDVRKLLNPLMLKDEERAISKKSQSPQTNGITSSSVSPSGDRVPSASIHTNADLASKATSLSKYAILPTHTPPPSTPNLKEISKYVSNPAGGNLPSDQAAPLKESSEQILKKISKTSINVKPLSYYKLQVLNEHLSNKNPPTSSHSPLSLHSASSIRPLSTSSKTYKPSYYSSLASSNLPKSSYFKAK